MSLDKGHQRDYLGFIWIVIVGIVGSHTNAVMPAIIGTLSSRGGIAIALVGLIASLELVGLAVAVVSLATFVNHVRQTRIARCGSVLLLASNIASVFWQSYFALLIFRFFAGVGAGLVLGLASSLLVSGRFAKSTSPQRMFGIFYSFHILLSFLAYQVWSYIERLQGARGPFLWLSLVAVMCVLASFQLSEDSVRHRKSTDHDHEISFVWWGVALIGIFLFNAAGNCLWSQVIGLGIYKGVRAEDLHKILSFVVLSQLFAMIISAWIGSNLGPRKPIILGGGALFIGMLSVVMSHTRFVFTASLFVFIFFWSLVTPFVMGSSSILDPKGRLAGLSVAALYGGLAVAPAIAGSLLKTASGEYTLVLYLSIGLLPLGLFLLIYALSHPSAAREVLSVQPEA
ncbi:MAG: MFS transporter [Syntrophobacteraceae bacterium]